MNNQSEHTPGPWELREHTASGLEVWAKVNIGRDMSDGVLQPLYNVSIRPQLEVGEDGQVYAQVSYESWRQFPSTAFDAMQKANARLIVAAPEMLDALKGLLRQVGDRRIPDYLIAQAVISKAEASK